MATFFRVKSGTPVYLVEHWSGRKNVEQRAECDFVASFRLHTFDAWCQAIIVDRLFLPVIVVRLCKKPEIILAEYLDIVRSIACSSNDHTLKKRRLIRMRNPLLPGQIWVQQECKSMEPRGAPQLDIERPGRSSPRW